MARLRRVLTLLLALLGLWQLGSAAYIPLKAALAQRLLELAWQRSAGGTLAIRPWRGADTAPVARLSFPRLDRELLVLDGAGARNLAFGPVHVGSNAWPLTGSTLIAGHRDTHFALLQELVVGDVIELERAGRRHRFSVSGAEVIDQDSVWMLTLGSAEQLLLVTCYPFAAIKPGTPWRYVVTATAGPADSTQD